MRKAAIIISGALVGGAGPPADQLGNWERLFSNAERFAAVSFASHACSHFGYQADMVALQSHGRALIDSFGEKRDVAEDVLSKAVERVTVSDGTALLIAADPNTPIAQVERYRRTWAGRCAEVANDPIYGQYFTRKSP